MMRPNRNMILFVLAFLTVCFLGAAYTLWFNPTGLPLVGNRNNPLVEPEPIIDLSANDKGLKLTITESGIVALSDVQLRNAGLSFSELSSDEFLLTYNGQPVPFLVRQEEDETLLYFYAEAGRNPLEPLAVYELRRGSGIEMLERDAQPFNKGEATAKHLLDWEDDRLFVEDATPGDAWMGPILLAPDRWTLRLNTIRPDGRGAKLAVRLFTNVEADDTEQHHVEIRVNDERVAEHYWQGAGQEVIRIPLKDGILKPNDENSISVVAFDDIAPEGEAIYVDSLELSYEGPIDISNQAVTFVNTAPNLRIDGADDDVLVFDITDPKTPVALTGIRPEGDSAHFSPGAKDSTFIALNPGDSVKPDLETTVAWDRPLRDPDRGADYLIIVADVRGFGEAISPLITHREEQGFRVEAVPVMQVFDEFSYGHRDPQAIKDFIAYTTENWASPAPQYVLLAGDATYDVTNQIPGKNRNRLPTQIVYTYEGGYVADDAWFTLDKDNVAQMAIGRFPAQNAPQLRAMVNKTIAYEVDLMLEESDWTREALLVADHEEKFDEDTANLAHYLEGNGYSVYRVHMSNDDNTHHKIISALDEGVGLVNYMGRGSTSAWSDQGVFQNSDAQVLENGENLPILSTFTCRSGSFADPRTDSLVESLLRANHAGIVAAVAPSGQVAEGHQTDVAGMFFAQYTDENSERLGDALRNMYSSAGEFPLMQEAMTPVNLLGDPALIIGRPD